MANLATAWNAVQAGIVSAIQTAWPDVLIDPEPPVTVPDGPHVHLRLRQARFGFATPLADDVTWEFEIGARLSAPPTGSLNAARIAAVDALRAALLASPALNAHGALPLLREVTFAPEPGGAAVALRVVGTCQGTVDR